MSGKKPRLVEFTDDQFPDLREVDGILLQDCKGQRVAIGQGFDYQTVWDFMSDFINQYGIDEWAKILGFDNGADYLRSTHIHQYTEENMLAEVMQDFNGDYADDLQDDFDYNPDEGKLEDGDHKYACAAGK